MTSLLKDLEYTTVYSWGAYRVLKITDIDDSTYFKVFGANSGGYLSGDEWRLNSGISKVVYDDEEIAFFGYSGSVYLCAIGDSRVSLYNQSALNNFLAKDFVELVEHDKLFDTLKEYNIHVEYVGGKDD